MMTISLFNMEYKKPAEKFFIKHENIRQKYIQAIEDFMTGDNSETADIKIIKGEKNNYYRMHIGEWRVIFTIIDGVIVVINIILASSRGDIYKKIGGLK